jgi:hypothetical protein
MRRGLTCIFILAEVYACCQSNKEFEGIIRYQHKFLFTYPGIDTSAIKDELGTSSVFYYKEGNYKWIITSEKKSDIEYFNAATQTVFFLYGNNDTLFMGPKNGYDDSLLLFKEDHKNYTICGLNCRKAETISVAKNDTAMVMKRTVYYSPAVPVAPGRFSSYRTYASNEVIKKTNSWPLKIELGSPRVPFVFILEAVEIIPKQLSPADVYLPADKPVKQLSLF